MSTRSRRSYKPVSDAMTEEVGSIADLMKVLIEDRRSREAQYQEKRGVNRKRWNWRGLRCASKWDILRRIVGSRRADEEMPPAIRTTSECEARLVKLSAQDNVELYLTVSSSLCEYTRYTFSRDNWLLYIRFTKV